MQEDFREKRIAELEGKIKELKSRLPAHSIPVSMIQELEVLEEQLKLLKKGD